VTVLGHRIHLDRQDSLLLSVNGVYEALETRLFEESIAPGDVVVDVGAHIGYYTLLAARAVGPQGSVIAFEPERENFRHLSRNLAENGYTNVTCVNGAVSDRSGRQALFISSDNTGDHRIYTGDEKRAKYSVDVVSLDDFFADRSKSVNVIKMDVQGAEPKVLEGMKALLRANDDVVLFTELGPRALQDANTSARELVDSLEEAGFELYRIDEEHESVARTSADRLAGMPDLTRADDHLNLLCGKGETARMRLRGNPSFAIDGTAGRDSVAS
jgi:FkbM family methyltransferase